MLWRPSHTDTAKAAILGADRRNHVRQSQGVSCRNRHCSGPAVWEKAERMGTMESESMGRGSKTPRNQPDGGWQVVIGREERERTSLSGWRFDARPGVLDFWVYRVVTDCHRFDRLRFAR